MYLASVPHYPEAARVFENLVAAYPAAREILPIRLMLGLIYRRYLGRPDLAVTQLRAALAGLSDPRQRAVAESELALAEQGVRG